MSFSQSAISNVEKYVDENENTKLIIRVIKDIEPGTELSYCYDGNSATFGFKFGCKCSDCEVHRARLELELIKENKLFLKRNVWAGLKRRNFGRLSERNLMTMINSLSKKQNEPRVLDESQKYEIKVKNQHELCGYIFNQL